MNPTPDSAPNALDARVRYLVRWALWFGALPLVTGVSITIAWVRTEADWLVSAGLFNIAIGLLLFMVGLLALGSAWLDTRQSSEKLPPGTRRKAWLAWILLFANFPAAFSCISTVFLIESSYSIRVENQSQDTITELELWGAGTERAFGTLTPNTSKRRRLYFKSDGALRFRAKRNGKNIAGPVLDYVTAGGGGSSTLRFLPDGQFETDWVGN